MNKELTIDILSSVAKPARYTGDEFGSIVKTPEETEVNIALAFPDVYEIGMSYLGFKILYHIVNKERGLVAERVCARGPIWKQKCANTVYLCAALKPIKC